MTHRRPVLAALFLTLCSCKEITSMVVGGTVSAGKEVTSGIVEGVEEGRKSGESIDGAIIVSNAAELATNGAVVVHEIRSNGGAGSVVTLAFENKADRPLRLTGVEVLALDLDDFAQRPIDATRELTVPAKAKDQLNVSFPVPPERLKVVRVWGEDHPVPAVTVPAPEPPK